MAAVPRYPVMLDLSGRRCLVIGGGAVAHRKVRGLVEAGAHVTVVAPALGAALAELLEEQAPEAVGTVTWIERRVDSGDRGQVTDLVDSHDLTGLADLAPARWALVVTATDDAGLNASVATVLGEMGVWVVDASSPTGGAVSTPAVHRAGPVSVAVSTSGVSPGAAGWLRDQLADALDPAVIEALELLEEVMAERRESPAASASAYDHGEPAGRFVRVDWKRVLDSGTLDDIRHGLRARAKERLQACLSSSSD
ncbi:MAG: hypothetical protein GX643_02030 [Acidimicrobiales bacterium]|nr:hypothetical protein [Acidimicrobiales bacterium]